MQRDTLLRSGWLLLLDLVQLVVVAVATSIAVPTITITTRLTLPLRLRAGDTTSMMFQPPTPQLTPAERERVRKVYTFWLAGLGYKRFTGVNSAGGVSVTWARNVGELTARQQIAAAYPELVRIDESPRPEMWQKGDVVLGLGGRGIDKPE